ncbi:hypothetical protein Tco_1561845 [Tanacetum coccineum]
MQIPTWMITDEMKQTEHYRMYAEVFGINVPLTQSQSTESTQGTHRTPSARISPNPNKESLEVEIAKENEVEITQETEMEITNVIIPVNVTDEDEEITDEVYELKRREKGKNVEETRNSPIPTPIRSPRIHTNLISSDTEKLQELTVLIHTTFFISSPHNNTGRRFMPRKSFDTLADNLHHVMVESLPDIVDKHIMKAMLAGKVPEQVLRKSCAVPGESSYGKSFSQEKQLLSTSDVDEIPRSKYLQDIMEEEMEHLYHNDQMKEFLKSVHCLGRVEKKFCISTSSNDHTFSS